MIIRWEKKLDAVNMSISRFPRDRYPCLKYDVITGKTIEIQKLSTSHFNISYILVARRLQMSKSYFKQGNIIVFSNTWCRF